MLSIKVTVLVVATVNIDDRMVRNGGSSAVAAADVWTISES
jgi:hypothetical protein